MLAVAVLSLFVAAGDPDEKEFLFKLHVKNLYERHPEKEKLFEKAVSHLVTSTAGLEEIAKAMDAYEKLDTSRVLRLAEVLFRHGARLPKALLPKTAVASAKWLDREREMGSTVAKRCIAFLSGPAAPYAKDAIPILTKMQESSDAEKALTARRILAAIKKAMGD